jgi:hypothetical protein
MVGRVAPRAPRLSTGLNKMTEIAVGPVACDPGCKRERLGVSGARDVPYHSAPIPVTVIF